MLHDLQALHIVNTVYIGTCLYTVRPYTVIELFEVIAKLKAIKNKLLDNGITLDNCFSVHNICLMIDFGYSFLCDEICLVLKMKKSDFAILSPEVVLKIVDSIVEVNLKSKELFEQYLKELGRKIKSDPNTEAEIAKAIQKLIKHGHSWSSLKTYSLAEIGIFFKTVVEIEAEERKENLSHLWMGANLQHDGIKEVLDSLTLRTEEEEIDKVNADWRRLASFMAKNQ